MAAPAKVSLDVLPAAALTANECAALAVPLYRQLADDPAKARDLKLLRVYHGRALGLAVGVVDGMVRCTSSATHSMRSLLIALRGLAE